MISARKLDELLARYSREELERAVAMMMERRESSSYLSSLISPRKREEELKEAENIGKRLCLELCLDEITSSLRKVCIWDKKVQQTLCEMVDRIRKILESDEKGEVQG